MANGVVFAYGPCFVCGTVHGFNVERVPSIEGQPICRDCIELINDIRRDEGHPPVVVYPDSYEPETT